MDSSYNSAAQLNRTPPSENGSSDHGSSGVSQPHLDRVLRYTEAGVSVIPVPYATKGRRGLPKGWLKTDFPYSVWREHYADKSYNIGLRLGSLVDIDLDCPETLALAGMFLPDTKAVFGRSGKPRSHQLYFAGRDDIQVFRDPVNNKNLLEVRGHGQTVGPGSVHEDTGEDIEWSTPTLEIPQIAHVDGVDLLGHATHLAVAALLGRYWPEDGRHDLELAVAGGLLRGQLSVEAVKQIIDGAYTAKGVPLDGATDSTVRSTAKTLADGEPASGWPTVVKLLGSNGQPIVATICKWLGIELGQYLYWSDFWAYSPMNTYFYLPTREMWVKAGVDSRIPRVAVKNVDGTPKLSSRGEPVYTPGTAQIDRRQAVEGMTWWPGKPQILEGMLVIETSIIERPGSRVFNTYRAPDPVAGNPDKVQPWLDHIKKLYPEHVDLIVAWFAHRVQRPYEAMSWAIVFGGPQGVGKDTIVHPVVEAVGSWNCKEITPGNLFSQFNPYVKSVILRISEARDTGENSRYAAYEHSKLLINNEPAAIEVNEKNIRPYSVPNVTSVIYTTNHLTSGMYIDKDDRRHFVVWTDIEKPSPEYFTELREWFRAGGCGHVRAYLEQFDLSAFNPMAPPPRTAAWREMVSAETTGDEGELGILLEAAWPDGRPEVINIPMLLAKIAANDTKALGGGAETYDEYGGLYLALTEHRRRRHVPKLLRDAGYRKAENPHREDGRWKIEGKPADLYVSLKTEMVSERVAAATKFWRANKMEGE